MPVLDFHLHVGIGHHWNPWVISFFQQINPEYIQDFADDISKEGVLEYLGSQEVDRAVVLSGYAPVTTGGVKTASLVRALQPRRNTTISRI